MKKSGHAFAAIAALVIVLVSTGTGKAQTSDLVGMLTSQLGVTEQQASSGAGSLLNFAKGQMGASDFDVVSSALPEVKSLVGAAPEASSGARSGLPARCSEARRAASGAPPGSQTPSQVWACRPTW